MKTATQQGYHDRAFLSDPDEVCDVCFRYVDDCVCPRCRECGSVGDPGCYAVPGATPAKLWPWKPRHPRQLVLTGTQWLHRAKGLRWLADFDDHMAAMAEVEMCLECHPQPCLVSIAVETEKAANGFQAVGDAARKLGDALGSVMIGGKLVPLVCEPPGRGGWIPHWRQPDDLDDMPEREEPKA